VYWAYQRLNGGAWSYSQVGAASTRVGPGAVEGWAWGSGSVQNGARPPTLSFEQVCAPADQPQLPTGAIVSTEAPAPATEPPRATPTIVPPTSAPTEPPAVLAEPPTAEASPTLIATTRPSAQPTAVVAQAATAAVSAAPSATFVSAEAVPTPGSAGGTGRAALSYLAFGGIALLLVVGIVATLRRRG
jgi:hypothetical protein